MRPLCVSAVHTDPVQSFACLFCRRSSFTLLGLVGPNVEETEAGGAGVRLITYLSVGQSTVPTSPRPGARGPESDVRQ